MSHDKNVHDKKMHDKKSYDKKENENIIEGRNAVMEAFRSGKPVDKLYVLDGCQDGAVRSIIREARKHDTILNFVEKDRLNQLSETGKHQGVIASVAAYEYAEVEDMLKLAEEKGEDPFLIILDNIEDPHNLGAIIRTANQAGAHGVIIPKRRAVGLTATVARTSAGALNYTPVAKVTNLVKTMEDLKKKGLWFVCADMDGDVMYDVNMKGPIGLVIGNEGRGEAAALDGGDGGHATSSKSKQQCRGLLCHSWRHGEAAGAVIERLRKGRTRPAVCCRPYRAPVS